MRTGPVHRYTVCKHVGVFRCFITHIAKLSYLLEYLTLYLPVFSLAQQEHVEIAAKMAILRS